MKLTDCHNIDDFRRLSRRWLPWPVFDYIDGAADDEITKTRNTSAFHWPSTNRTPQET